MRQIARSAGAAALALLLAAAAVAAPPPDLRAPSPERVAEARQIVAAMAAADRGPFLRLRWFCKDGTVLPPKEYACVPHGGGRQHGEYSPARARLAELGWPVGTVLAALSWDEFSAPTARHRRLQHLVLERFMVETMEGWVMRKARGYRGHVQIEDEEAAGRNLLVRLLSDPRWVEANFLLARELVRVLPHHGGEDRTRDARRLSQDLAEKRATFEPLRVRIHTSPGVGEIEATRRWLAANAGGPDAPAIQDLGRRLVVALEALLNPGTDVLKAGAARLAKVPAWKAWAERLQGKPPARGPGRLAWFATSLREARVIAGKTSDGAATLTAMDLSLVLERLLSVVAREELRRGPLPRHEWLEFGAWLAVGAEGAGLLSSREAESALEMVMELQTAEAYPLDVYQRAVRRLRRVPGWALGNARHAFAEALVFYEALDPRAVRFVDDLLRASVMLPMADVLATVARDLDERTGTVHRVLGEPVGGVMALNPGVALGRLLEVDPAPGKAPPPREAVALLTRTVSELSPVAGILSRAEGNLLSHVQLLARNLGIPNASISARAARLLRPAIGAEVLVAVGSGGSVVVERAAGLSPRIRDLVTGPATGVPGGGPLLDAPRPDLTMRRPLPLGELHSGLSGKVVGPKAANLGQLARTFPGRVAPALALPFGLFHAYTARGPDSPRARIDRAYADFRAGRLDAPGLEVALAEARAAIAAIRFDAKDRERLGAWMDRHLGGREAGVFVRSDTNVEDLPGFTGAGLNETRPHVVGLDAVADAIPGVWSSMLSPRSLAWRASLLARPEEVYCSVLLMQSVPADKSGVLVTRDLVEGGPGLTVSTAWGVGGAVDGEEAETLVLRPDGSVTLVAEAGAPYRRTLLPRGGVGWVPAPAGQVLTEAEQARLRELAAEVEAKLAPARDEGGAVLPWDIEFGFRGGELTLFQIRPLVQRGDQRADRVVEALAPSPTGAAGVVSMRQTVAAATEEGDE